MTPITLEHITLDTLSQKLKPLVGDMTFTITITPDLYPPHPQKNEIHFWDDEDIKNMGKLSLVKSTSFSSL